MATNSPFHAGEQQVQARLGVREAIEPWARQVIRPRLTAQHQAFFNSLPFLVAAARDSEGRPWATLLVGEPGFVDTSDPHRLSIAAELTPGDALEGAFVAGADLGLLGIELHTRRRNRVNGRVAGQGADALLIAVDQTFGNCPQYIHPRTWQRVPAPSRPAAPLRTDRLTDAMRDWISCADTFFIASGHRGEGESPAFGMDASHRGGDPGFVHIENDTTLVFPDYAGNNHYNTIGNLVVEPCAGLLFVDFERGGLLQLSGHTRIDWDPGSLRPYPAAQRLVRFEVEAAVARESVLPLRWSAPEEAVRTLRLARKVRESEDVISFVFESRDGGPLPPYAAGQHLPIELAVPDHGKAVSRTYSLSGNPRDERYRISVKRMAKGLVSRLLHDEVTVGAFLESRAPAGDFTLVESERPVVLVSVGIGITPMVSMLHALVSSEDDRPVWFAHGARDGAHHALAEEVRGLVASSERVASHVAYSRPRRDDTLGIDFDSLGRVDAALLEQLLPGLGAEFYLCGPRTFMAEIQQGLSERGVPAERIHTETFGPAA